MSKLFDCKLMLRAFIVLTIILGMSSGAAGSVGDAAPSLNAIIAACPVSGCVVRVPAALYILNTSGISITTNNVSLVCDEGAIFQAQTGFSNNMIGVAANDVLVQGCILDANGIANIGIGVYSTSQRVRLDRNEVKNVTGGSCFRGVLRTGGVLKITHNYCHNSDTGFYDYSGIGGTPTHQVDYNSFDTITNATNAIAVGSSGIADSEVSENQFSNITAGTQEVLYCFGDDRVEWHHNYFNNVTGAVHADTVGGGTVSFNTAVSSRGLADYFTEASSYMTMEGNVSIGNFTGDGIIMGEGSSVSPASLLNQFFSFDSTTGFTAGANVVLTTDTSDKQEGTGSMVATANGSFTTGTLWYFNFSSPQIQLGGFEELWVKPTSGTVSSGLLSLVCSANTALSTQDLVVPLSPNTMSNSTWYRLIQYENRWQGAAGGNGGSNNGWKSCGVIVNSSSPSLVVKFDDLRTGSIQTGNKVDSNKVSLSGGMRCGACTNTVFVNNYVEFPGGAVGIAYGNNESVGTIFQNNRSLFTTGAFYPSGPNNGGTHLSIDAVNSASSVISSNDTTNAALQYSLTNNGTVLFQISGVGAPAAGLCTAASGGSTYLRTDGSTSTTLYVCDNATHVWTAK
jgi:hypothetical protein